VPSTLKTVKPKPRFHLLTQVAGDLRAEGGMVSRDDEVEIATLQMQPPFLRGKDRVVFLTRPLF
jgi:hypothetical protein